MLSVHPGLLFRISGTPAAVGDLGMPRRLGSFRRHLIGAAYCAMTCGPWRMDMRPVQAVMHDDGLAVGGGMKPSHFGGTTDIGDLPARLLSGAIISERPSLPRLRRAQKRRGPLTAPAIPEKTS
jgi:hypothetical protein